MKTIATAAASIALIAAATLTAAAADADKRGMRATTTIKSAQFGGTPTASPFDNKAKAWTSACYAEFGPNATNPDAALLQKCLDY